jgi:hypothetical protein
MEEHGSDAGIAFGRGQEQMGAWFAHSIHLEYLGGLS